MELINKDWLCVQKRHPVDLLASAAAVAMGGYGTGSSRGYDEMVPHYVSSISEMAAYWRQFFSVVGFNLDP